MPRQYAFKDKCLVNNSDQVLGQAGKNIIPEQEKQSLWKSFLEKFTDPLIVILLVVLVLSVGISAYEMVFLGRSLSCLIEPLGIFIAIMLATGIAFLLEVNAEKAFRILNRKKDERPVKVLRWKTEADRRDGRKRPSIFQVKRCDVVIGDIVRLESGDEVPADGFLLEAANLRVDESNFTGEPFTSKYVDPEMEPGEPTYPANFLLRGTVLLEGSAIYQVSATGPDTEEGKGAQTLREEEDVQTPLNAQLKQFARGISIASYIIAALILIGRMVYFFFFDGDPDNNHDALAIVEFALNSVMIAVTLIVVAVPEGLPMSVTVSLALSMRKMLRQNNLVRKMHACETIGAATVICTDKTGTLTKNRMEVRQFEPYFPDFDLIAWSICVNSTAELTEGDATEGWKTVGNPTEGALLAWLKDHPDCPTDYETCRDESTVLEQEPFRTEIKYMSTTAVRDETGRKYKLVKGAPEIVLAMCGTVGDGTPKETVTGTLADFQRRGMRTLGFAIQPLDEADAPLAYVGTVAIQDPVRDDVRDAIMTCRRAGVRVIMVTGDVALTANEIGYESGILAEGEEPQLLTGSEFAAMDPDYLKEHVLKDLKILSRARPEDKLRLVSLLQEMGEIVAVTGDGTNDALALKKAHVGLSMGDGTARAKEASDITIIDNSFSSINNAILWGRSLYLNIKRFILFQMTINVTACLVVLLGAFLGLDSPLTVTQMLWVNLIMDTFAAMALSSLPPDRNVMRSRPRNPKSHILDRGMIKTILLWGGAFFLFLTGLWQLLWHLNVTPEDGVFSLISWDSVRHFFTDFLDFSKTKAHMSGYEQGIFFTTFVMLQFWNLFNARYYRTDRSFSEDFIGLFTGSRLAKSNFSQGFLGILAIILVGQILIVNVLGELFEVAPLGWTDWLWLFFLPMIVIMLLPDLRRMVLNQFKAGRARKALP